MADEFFSLPPATDSAYWDRVLAVGLHQPMSDEERALIDAELAAQTFKTNGQPSENTWQPINLGRLEERPAIQPTLGGVGLVYPGKRHVFSGPQESAKTLAAYAISIEIVRQDGKVVVIDFEMGRWDARDRFRELGATPDELANIYYVEPAEPANPQHISTLVALEPQLVIIDAAAGAYDLQSLDDNKRGDVERFTGLYVRDFWRNNIATIVLDHVVKNLDNRGSYAIGSERKVGGADVHLGFHPELPISRGGKGVYKITTHKDRGGYLQRGRLADLHLESDPDTHHITWTFKEADHDKPFRPTILMHRVSLWLQSQDEPASFTLIKSSVTGEDKTIALATEYLIREGYAREQVGPRDARLVSHITLYTDQPPPLRATNHAESSSEASVTSEKPPDLTPATPASTPAAQASTTPASPSKDAGDAGDAQAVTPAPALDVFDPAVQRLLDDPERYDRDIPF